VTSATGRPARPVADQDQGTVRPFPSPRGDVVVVTASRALLPWLQSADVRAKALAVGAFLASEWVTGSASTSPILGEQLPDPNLREVTCEYGFAALVAAGLVPMPTEAPGAGWTDLGRLVARGVEAWLGWFVWADVPVPGFLRPGAERHVFEMLGEVGLGDAGLDGPTISRYSFPALPGARVIASRDPVLVIR
jgi:hypothetical protein